MKRELARRLAQLRPSHEFSWYPDLVGSSVLFPQFASVVAGIRPGMDVWVPAPRVRSFVRRCSRYRLATEMDVAFREPTRKEIAGSVGGRSLVTTKALGIAPGRAAARDVVHVFVAKSRRWARFMRETGWYPVIVGRRVTYKPQIDYVEFGEALGYPPCCVDRFARSNNWNRTNTQAELVGRSPAPPYNHLLNFFGHRRGFSLVAHIPCSFACSNSLRMAREAEQYLQRVEPEYLGLARSFLQLPVFSTGDQVAVALHGRARSGTRVDYDDALDLTSWPSHVAGEIRRHGTLEIRGHCVALLQSGRVSQVLEFRVDQFAPESPVLFEWSTAG